MPHEQPSTKSALQTLSVGDNCTWSKCTSKAKFLSKASFNTHRKNVHRKPLVCSFPNCPRKTPFARLTDLKRHADSVHSKELKYICTVPTCSASVKAFARKDHLTKHRRERHDNYFCPLNHCPHNKLRSFSTPEDLGNHIEVDHEDYECAIQGCAQELLSNSKFCQQSAMEYLRNHHGMPDYSAFETIRRMQERGSSEIRAHLGRAMAATCKICTGESKITVEDNKTDLREQSDWWANILVEIRHNCFSGGLLAKNVLTDGIFPHIYPYHWRVSLNFDLPRGLKQW